MNDPIYSARPARPTAEALARAVADLYDVSSDGERLSIAAHLLHFARTKTVEGATRGVFAMAQVRLACSQHALRSGDLDRVTPDDVAALALFVDRIDPTALARLPMAIRKVHRPTPSRQAEVLFELARLRRAATPRDAAFAAFARVPDDASAPCSAFLAVSARHLRRDGARPGRSFTPAGGRRRAAS